MMCFHGRNKGKVPKRIHKAEREKLKREQLNELFLQLASALELTQPNNGKASILSEATRLLKDLLGQIEGLNKENASLLSESRYVTIEKNELKEENSALETQIEGLKSELEARVSQSKPDLNVPPPEFHHPELTQHFPGESLRLPAADATLQQAQAVIVVPLHPELQGYPVTNSNVSKPHARYPTSTDSWPSQLLEEQLRGRKEVQ
ncbi:transcription factor bHLH47 isoform X2 [Manihot esculenta]|uniref:Uncharacterized protein n=2 Tax=Manihot esculenta TaxID=3983 RepID=A0ACB7HJY7_MANES|nr:transcription factor bHLH47 isoform X2 [Manihot esculenta]XP_043813420.1 transcription factor bHLH47 isoform X2 [Manihot esculenta]KAG8652461.1 hypothetical protein MANES_06G094100v8 [Manihot esculenta]KAG8652462.1 hypothetical protein MANES_06G094100v8 [Manihot esculenta]